jgi:2-polyprenyl-6-methoxyphenol hydroxylase-like FAD-dependent oxidoreductase
MKIAISGAGVSGCALAYWLLRYGHEPTLIEVAPQFRAGGYVIDFWGIGYSIIERMGLLPPVRKAGYQVIQVRFVDDDGRQVSGFGVDSIRHLVQDRFTSLPRDELARVIHDSIKERAEVLFDNSIASLDEDADGVRVSLRSGDERRFDPVIGADGLHSRVRELAFGPQQQFEHDLDYCVAAFEASGYRPRDELTYVSHARPGRQISRFSLREDRTLFLLVFATSHLDGPVPRSTQERKETLARVYAGAGWETGAIIERLQHTEDLYFDRVSQISMPAWTRGRVALLGDAAACVSLLAGEGTGLAIAEAYVLAGEINRSHADHRAAFAAYKNRLHEFLDAKQKSARDFARTFAPTTEFGLWLRNQAMKLMAIPKIAELIIGGSLVDEIELPEYEIEADRSARRL